MVENVIIHFSAKEAIPRDQRSAAEYQQIWDEEGVEIIAALVDYSGLEWKEEEIEAVTFEGISQSRPLMLRSSYSDEVKKGTLVHELGHRLLSSHGIRRLPGQDSHQILDLFLYDVWVHLYGKEFADKMVECESQLKGIADYAGMWNEALAKTKDERAALFKAIRENQSENKV